MSRDTGHSTSQPLPPAATLRLVPRPKGDDALVNGLKRGDPDAARELFERFSRRIEGLVWRLLGPDAEHDDVVQQVYLAIARSIAKLRDPGALESWIVSVTMNTVRREIRSRSRRPRLEIVDSAAERVAQHTSPSARPDDLAFTTAFYRVLDQLQTRDRLVLVLRYLEGEPLVGVAAACGCSLATAKRRLRRARRRFRKRAEGDFWLSTWAARLEGGDHA